MYFQPSFKPGSNSDGFRLSLRNRPQKSRKIAEHTESASVDTEEESDSSGSEDSIASLANPSVHETTQSALATVSKNAAEEYHVAGQRLDQALPKGNFPHASIPPPSSTTGTRSHRELRDLANLKPPLCLAQQSESINRSNRNNKSARIGLRQQHLAVLTTIMHKCLLEGDYFRAERAWGMLLRAEVNGHHMDIRHHGRWGIGAEILYQKGLRDLSPNWLGSSPGKTAEDGIFEGERSSSKAFEGVKDYYERLILQYPFRKSSPNTVSALNFYPSMFELWLHLTQEQEAALAKSHDARKDLSPNSGDNLDRELTDTASFSEPTTGQDGLVRNATLQQAELILSRLDELLLSPPYSDDVKLLRLREMIALWINDLSTMNAPKTESEDDDGDDESSENEDEPQELRPERGRRYWKVA
ncbi:hypothetical protein MMC20_001926 [Loxospora ochrophaea]|nr:hypothetical protein [Loxospora ochrophaea]